GADRWRADRPRDITWTTPTVLPGWAKDGTDLVLLQGSGKLTAVEPRTGREAWSLERKSHPIASAVAYGGVVYVPGDEGGLAALQRQADGPPKVLWEQAKLNPAMAR